MLDAGSHTVRLQTFDIRNDHRCRQVRVFTHILEVTPVERCTIDIHSGSEHNALVPIHCLFAQSHAIGMSKVGVPCGSQTGERREGGARVVGPACLVPLVPHHLRTDTVRTIGTPYTRYTQTSHTGRGELRLCMQHVNLLSEGHTRQRVFNTSLKVGIGIKIDLSRQRKRRNKETKRKENKK